MLKGGLCMMHIDLSLTTLILRSIYGTCLLALVRFMVGPLVMCYGIIACNGENIHLCGELLY